MLPITVALGLLASAKVGDSKRVPIFFATAAEAYSSATLHSSNEDMVKTVESEAMLFSFVNVIKGYLLSLSSQHQPVAQACQAVRLAHLSCRLQIIIAQFFLGLQMILNSSSPIA